MKKTVFLIIGIAVILLASCASTGGSSARGGPPSEVSNWINQNSDTMYYGMGISEFTNESDALQQASNLARVALAASIEVQIAAISSDAVRRAEAQGQTDRVARFEAANKQIVDQTIRNVRTFGPYMNDRGNTYVVAFIDMSGANRDINRYVDEIFAATDAELNRILGLD